MTHSLLLDSTSGAPAASQLPQRWAAELEAVMQGDRHFFLEHPEQDYYVRPLTPVEVIEGRSLGKAVTEEARVLVGEVVPGSRVRLTILDGSAPPIAEFKAIRQQMRKQMGVKSADLKARLQQRRSRPKAKGFG